VDQILLAQDYESSNKYSDPRKGGDFSGRAEELLAPEGLRCIELV